jgi:Mn-dependent DtxR family transcriptional regulator
MLNNNDECNWSDFLEKPLEISLATLSKYMNILMSNSYVEKVSKGIYKVTSEGRKRYIDLRFKDPFEKKFSYPPEIILNSRNYDHIILWMLFNNNFCKWADFLEKPLSINHHSLSKNLNILLEKGFVDSENMEYRITKSGENQYNKMLKKYHLDYQTVLKEEIDKLEDTKKEVKSFLNKYKIEDNEVEIIFLDLNNHLDYERIENALPSREDFYKILLYLSLNHPNKYPEYISPNNFSLKYNIKLATLNFFVQNITEENLFPMKFFRLGLDEEKTYYFREDEKIDKMLHLIIDENIINFSYLNKLQPNIPKEEKDLQIVELLENILNDICDKLFDRNIKSSLKIFVTEYLGFIYSKFQKESHTDKLIDKFKGLAFQNLVGLNLDDFEKIKKEKTVLTSILRDFPKYVILDEIKKKMNK